MFTKIADTNLEVFKPIPIAPLAVQPFVLIRNTETGDISAMEAHEIDKALASIN